ncbi:OPT oligopeptide transporter protein-domain-containing protein [Lactifluus subvellereus]|nr:OPT oligopeptide transporter protein-domain-containing protein [Lactifluus subvellereus]
MSLLEDERRPLNPEGCDPEHLGKVGVGSISLIDSGDLGEAQGIDLDNYDDPNFDPTGSILQDDSPYAEVRSAVANTDDPMMPSSTFRAWVVGIIWAVLMAGVNQFFFFRYPTIRLTGFFSLLLTYPICKAWARYLPRISVFGISLNPGPFTIKEHVIIMIMADICSVPAYATGIIAVQRVYYNQHPNFVYQWLLVMSTQLIGFSISGIYKRILVAPPSMIWPENLSAAALFNTLHAQETTGTRGQHGISRDRFFTYIFIGYFFYNFLPSYLFTALSTFSWVCWIAPNNVKVNQIFGVSHGLGMGLITFDWGVITAFIGTPLTVPWWAAANVGITVMFFYWFLLPNLYYSNVWYSAYLPLVSSQPFDNTGSIYNVSRTINADSSFNLQAYQSYSPVFLSVSFVMSYGLSFASITAVVMHTLLYHSKQILTQSRRSLSDQPDIHARLMSVYKEVPDWWYLLIFLTTFAFGVFAIETWDTGFPVWAFVLALVISLVYTIPIGVIQAVARFQVGLNAITEALIFTGYLKLGHYMKVPHRPTFFCQIVASVVAGTHTVFGTASIIWGVIGPRRLFSLVNSTNLVFSFLVGAVFPLIQWTLHKKFRMTFLKYLNFPVIFASIGFMPPATPINYVPWVLICFLFNYIIRRRHILWWLKYNYVLSAGLDAGYAVGAIVIFFVLQYPKNGTIGLNSIQNWWGNTVYTKTADYAGLPAKTVPGGGTFGPSSW